MDGVRLMDRIDTKYVFRSDELGGLLSAVRDDYRVLEVDGLTQSPYSTVYYDTAALDCYHDHHKGKANRRKYRMRTYLSSGDRFFEVKTKTNKGRTVKRRLSVPGSSIRTDSEPSPAEPRLDEEGPAQWTRSLTGTPVGLTPRLRTSFRRITLVGRAAAERVTIDTDLAFAMGGRTRPLTDLVIAEVKQERARRDSAIRVRLRSRGIRPLGFSKYCLGSAIMDPTLKHNRFKSKLLTLRLSLDEEAK